ncbi:hypothetical protein PVAP13_2NG042400 [Panicum virgatum]|uniref:Uncharacterized protein n=1 Tax=Panicum virgatum TaxID=38727 RepID=A0A8T0VDV3_PANVG|nr:hypothetical protein PVAP13_2NG042400 [Panicum virgatum]
MDHSAQQVADKEGGEIYLSAARGEAPPPPLHSHFTCCLSGPSRSILRFLAGHGRRRRRRRHLPLPAAARVQRCPRPAPQRPAPGPPAPPRRPRPPPLRVPPRPPRPAPALRRGRRRGVLVGRRGVWRGRGVLRRGRERGGGGAGGRGPARVLVATKPAAARRGSRPALRRQPALHLHLRGALRGLRRGRQGRRRADNLRQGHQPEPRLRLHHHGHRRGGRQGHPDVRWRPAGREDGEGELPGGAAGRGEENGHNGWPQA